MASIHRGRRSLSPIGAEEEGGIFLPELVWAAYFFSRTNDAPVFPTCGGATGAFGVGLVSTVVLIFVNQENNPEDGLEIENLEDYM